jgi:hypothetical protein
MELGIGILIGASLGYVLGAIMRTGKQADIEREPELPSAMKKSAAPISPDLGTSGFGEQLMLDEAAP